MIQLFALRLAVAFWRYTLSTSKKLHGRTWIALALVHVVIAVVSFWAYTLRTFPESEIPPVHQAQMPLYVVLDRSSVSHHATYSWRVNAGSSIKPTLPGFAWSLIGTHSMTLSIAPRSQQFNLVVFGENYAGHVSYVQVVPSCAQFRWEVPRWPKENPIVVRGIVPDPPDLLTPAQQIVAILVSIVTTLIAIVNTLMAWQVYRRSKAQEILMRLQIAKIQRELAELTSQDATAHEVARSSLVTL